MIDEAFVVVAFVVTVVGHGYAISVLRNRQRPVREFVQVLRAELRAGRRQDEVVWRTYSLPTWPIGPGMIEEVARWEGYRVVANRSRGQQAELVFHPREWSGSEKDA